VVVGEVVGNGEVGLSEGGNDGIPVGDSVTLTCTIEGCKVGSLGVAVAVTGAGTEVEEFCALDRLTSDSAISNIIYRGNAQPLFLRNFTRYLIEHAYRGLKRDDSGCRQHASCCVVTVESIQRVKLCRCCVSSVAAAAAAH
jgi:hypothetical protein